MSHEEDVRSLFAPGAGKLEPEVAGVLGTMIRLYSISPQELFYKWESYCLKMGPEETSLDLPTVRMFQKDVQDSLERSNQNKSTDRKSTSAATPRNANKNNDVYGMLDELTPGVGPRRSGSVKRKNDFETPAPKRYPKPTGKTNGNVTPSAGTVVSFAQRKDAGAIIETLNSQLDLPEPPIAPFAEPRIKPVANTDVKKFAYKPMSMRLADASEVLDDKIEEFMLVVQKHYRLEDSAFGNAAVQSTNQIVAVGRIACDTPEGKLNPASLLLELSRKWGGGFRVPLKVDDLSSYTFFPGQIVALRGTNASGQYFQVSEILQIPNLPLPVSAPSHIEAMNERLGCSEDSEGHPLNVLFASGPYTADDNLDFEPLQALCAKAIDDMVDAMVLTGPFLDIEHPLLATGDFDVPDMKISGDEGNMTSLFRMWISSQLEKVCSAIPSVTIILVPSVRDFVSRHVSWPQENIIKRELYLPRQVKMLPDPCFISLNEIVLGITSHDILFELSREQITLGDKEGLLSTLPSYLIQQRHFFPLYPSLSREKLPQAGSRAVGDSIDLGYSKLGAWPNVSPDILFLPSLLNPSVRVVEGVTVINPGFLSKRKAAGTFARMTLKPRTLTNEEQSQNSIPHDVYNRARVDVLRI